jgi:ketosteroid isomerase-like protein
MTENRDLSLEARQDCNVQTLHTYFGLLEDKDIDGWLALWAEGGTQLIPYAVHDLPAKVSGKDELRTLYQGIADSYRSVRFTSVEFYPLHDSDRVFARWHPYGEFATGGSYSNDSIGLFDFDEDGKIVSYTEYFNPLGFNEIFNIF